MATVPTIAELKAQARELDLEGREVLDFIDKQQAFYRGERAAERSAAAAVAAAEEKQREREHEIRLLELRARAPSADPTDNCLKPKLPVFQDKDDITSYLIRFERIAGLLRIDRNSYAVRLGTLLTGRALRIFAALSPEITDDYDSLKKALLTGFNKTPDTYREEFRSMRIGPNETYQQFAIQLGRALDFWLESRQVTQDVESVKQFFLVDQFLCGVPPPLRQFIKEQDGHTLPDVVKLADNWSVAHKAYPTEKKPSVPNYSPQSLAPLSTQSSRPLAGNSSPRAQRFVPQLVRKCFSCGDPNHVKRNCPKNPQLYHRPETDSTHKVNFCLDDKSARKYYTSGTVNGSHVSTILRDSGCSSVIVSDDVLPDADVSSCPVVTVSDYLGRTDEFPVVKCYIKCPYFCGWVQAIRAPIKFCTVLIGNVPGASDLSELSSDSSCKGKFVNAVQTRASSKVKPIHPLILPKVDPLNIDPDKFKTLQQTCPSLNNVRVLVRTAECVTMRDKSEFKFIERDGLIYRFCVKSKSPRLIGRATLVVPAECRQSVLKMGHESPLAGHFGHRKTEMRIRELFFWPSVTMDIRQFCRSCDKCQRFSPKGQTKRVPLEPMPVITEPFSKVAIDLVGPLTPSSSEGHKYILTLIDHATGFPEAVPMKDIDSISVAEALLSIFARVGIPREILSDRGTQFTSQLMGELHKLLGVKPLFTTPYHPMGNGRIERVHGPLKACLKKLCEDKPKEWHRYLIPTLFALRELPSDRSGFSAFELLYGRQVRGPLRVLRDLWEQQHMPQDQRSSFQYVIELQEKLEECAKIAAQNAKISVERYKSYFDTKTQDRQFAPGNEVLVLLPDSTNKLLMSWKGPFRVLERKSRVTYLIDDNGSPKLYHANLLKRYFRRATVGHAYVADSTQSQLLPIQSDPLYICQNCVVEDYETDNLRDHERVDQIECLDVTDSGSININPFLSEQEKFELDEVTSEYKDVLSPIPGCTDAVVYDITLMTSDPVRARFYPVPIHLKPHFDKEVDDLLDLGIIQPSKSSFSSPVVMVKKPDASYRLTVDYRALNAITVFQAEPPCLVDTELHKFSDAKFFSELDLTRAYHQIPLHENSRHLTAFPTSRGLMEYVKLPFGLVNACSRYAHLMRIVLHGLINVCFYFDNIFVYAKSWSDHLIALQSVFSRLREYGLTAKPSKCFFGFPTVNYLGFIVGHNELRPQLDKIKAISELPTPQTKKLLRSFIGLVSFYRRFIPHASTYMVPLTEMLKKEVPEPLTWSSEALQAFQTTKDALIGDKVLKLPSIDKEFILRTDASGTGIGAVLLQYHDDVPHPVAYASRKLMDRETRYSTIERECLAIVWGIQKFKFYLLGKMFYLEVDHKPLIFLNKLKCDNSRLMRWALSLQPYKFQIVHISGVDNIGADLLSRLPKDS